MSKLSVSGIFLALNALDEYYADQLLELVNFVIAENGGYDCGDSKSQPDALRQTIEADLDLFYDTEQCELVIPRNEALRWIEAQPFYTATIRELLDCKPKKATTNQSEGRSQIDRYDDSANYDALNLAFQWYALQHDIKTEINTRRERGDFAGADALGWVLQQFPISEQIVMPSDQGLNQQDSDGKAHSA